MLRLAIGAIVATAVVFALFWFRVIAPPSAAPSPIPPPLATVTPVPAGSAVPGAPLASLHGSPAGEVEWHVIEDEAGSGFQLGDVRWKLLGVGTASRLRLKEMIGYVLAPTYERIPVSGGGSKAVQNAGGKFVIVGLEVENLAKQPKSMMNLSARLKDGLGREFSSTTSGFDLMPGLLNSQSLNPNVPVQGTFVFDVAQDATGLSISLNNLALVDKDKQSRSIQLPDLD